MNRRLATVSGHVLDLARPDPSMIRIEDIAAHLSRINRWVGALHFPVNVAAHSTVVARADEYWTPEQRAAALLHDAPEYALGDIIYPLKQMLPNYQRLEERWADAIVQRFGLDWRTVPRLKNADLLALRSESETFGELAHLDVIMFNLEMPELKRTGIRCPKMRARAAEVYFMELWDKWTGGLR